MTEAPQTIFLKDYKPVAFLIDRVELEFHLLASATRVKSKLHMRPNPAQREGQEKLILDGEKITLISIRINGGEVAFNLTDQHLTIANPPLVPFIMEIETECDPKGNTSLSGLYQSNGMFCTQCEAEGFRRITYFHDRPDVMATYEVKLIADRQAFPVLLSNGNRGVTGHIPGTDDHYTVWHDPHPKPSYLFALVAGDLACVKDQFTTSSGKSVELGIYVEKGKQDRCAWAMESLKASMRWDEKRFGLEYDLHVFNIVAVSDFNMGAMENKGLNIFNDKYILALPETATDTDYLLIEGIIAHEYFHNWTGNRITCREWFQLCLKEGLTVFRDQEFTSDLRSRSVKRIQDVDKLRMRQFPEDASSLAHPPRPNAYMEINNFYTPTVYEKGAEICRMIQTLIGVDGFRKGMDLYFARHDGEAATVENFVACMAEASGRDFGQFFAWYEQAGTPEVSVTTRYDAAKNMFAFTVKQETRPTAEQAGKVALHFPLGVGLIAENGEELPLNVAHIEMTREVETFTFGGVKSRPVLSINRGFSAPIILKTDLTAADQLHLLAHDSDSFNRWQAGQFLATAMIIALVRNEKTDAQSYAAALARCLADVMLDDAFKALLLALPSPAEIAAAIGTDVDANRVYLAISTMRKAIGEYLLTDLKTIVGRTSYNGPYTPDVIGMARRDLRSAALRYLASAMPSETRTILIAEIASANNMTSEIGALSILNTIDGPDRQTQLNAFLQRHHDDHLLVDKWFTLSAQTPGHGSAARIEKLMQHSLFKMTTPNRVYALVGGFTGGNFAGFHAADGEGYRVVADIIMTLNGINPQVASRMATSFRSWRMFDVTRCSHAQKNMERILATPDLSRDVYEIISRTLQS